MKKIPVFILTALLLLSLIGCDGSAPPPSGDINDLSLSELEPYLGTAALDDAVSARELGDLLNKFLKTVKRDSRNMFLRRYWFGDSVTDIARDMGMTENAVSVRLSRTRDQLRTYLQKAGY